MSLPSHRALSSVSFEFNHSARRRRLGVRQSCAALMLSPADSTGKAAGDPGAPGHSKTLTRNSDAPFGLVGGTGRPSNRPRLVGAYVPRRDSRRLAANIRIAWTGPSLRQRLRRAGRPTLHVLPASRMCSPWSTDSGFCNASGLAPRILTPATSSRACGGQQMAEFKLRPFASWSCPARRTGRRYSRDCR